MRWRLAWLGIGVICVAVPTAVAATRSPAVGAARFDASVDVYTAHVSGLPGIRSPVSYTRSLLGTTFVRTNSNIAMGTELDFNAIRITLRRMPKFVRMTMHGDSSERARALANRLGVIVAAASAEQARNQASAALKRIRADLRVAKSAAAKRKLRSRERDLQQTVTKPAPRLVLGPSPPTPPVARWRYKPASALARRTSPVLAAASGLIVAVILCAVSFGYLGARRVTRAGSA